MRMLEDKKPLISVIMGVRYRRESIDLLRRAVESILNQTITDFEFLICENGSNDVAKQYLQLVEESDSRVHLICGDGADTLAAKLNACLHWAKGVLIARMDDDDVSHPERFERQVVFLNDHTDVDFVGCNVALQTEGGQVGSRTFPEYPKVKNFYFTQPFIHPTLVFRREVLLAVGGYSAHKQQALCEDYDLLLRLYTAGYCGANLQENLFDYTVPITAKGNRKMKHRWNETVTRWCRFKELDLLPKALPYVVKPLVVGLLPESLLAKVKRWR